MNPTKQISLDQPFHVDGPVERNDQPATVAFFMLDTSGKILTVNQKACENLGYSRDELRAMYMWDFSLGMNPDRFARLVEIQEHAPQVVRGMHRKKDGTTYPVEVVSVKMRSDGEDVLIAFVQDVSERKRAEHALKESEQRYRTLYEHTPVMMHSLDQNAHIISVNRYWLEVLGYHQNEVVGRKVTEFLTESSARYGIDYHFFQKFMKTGTAKNLELQLVKKEGEVIDVLLNAHGTFDVEGNLLYTQSFMVDVTERKRALEAVRESERRLRESQERLATILASAMDAIITIDEKGSIVLFNAAAEKVFRCQSNKAIGMSVQEYLSANFSQLLENYVRSSTQGGPQNQSMWAPEGLSAIRTNGEEFPVEATISEADLSDQKLFTIILRDINERKTAEAELNKLHLQNVYLQEEIKSEFNFGEIIGTSQAMQQLYKSIEMVARTDTTVLLIGETGTGKELIARAVHNLSPRKNRVLIKVNCGALPSGLVESELFGHEKGAFTGAQARKKGRFELAHSGTIFLDEVGELPLEAQIKLMRVLQEQEFERVGGTETLKVDVRVIAATNRNLEEAVKQGAFRADLYYRLNIFPIQVPALRKRVEDIPLLANYFVNKFSRNMGKRIVSISQAALGKLCKVHWHGNVRELANVLERAVILCEARVLQPQHLSGLENEMANEHGFPTLDQAERAHILKALEKTGGVLAGPRGAAQLLGINRSTLWSRMRRLGILTDSNKTLENLGA
ncbi:MAG: sigma 54-interacting transcriptional regulator [bacterium]